jgi:hypothetical protein
VSSEYRIDLKTPAGEKVAEFTGTDGDGFLGLAYTRRVNEPGLLSFTLDGHNPDLGLFQRRGQVEVWRRNRALGIPWGVDFRGLYLGQKLQTQDVSTVQVVCPGVMTMLSWRHIAYPADTANRTTFTNVAAETVMSTLVYRNASTGATTADGRLRDGALPGISVATDQGRGNLVSWTCAWDNLLTSLQQLAGIAGGDFDLVQTGPQAWQFAFYPGQRGTDRSGTLTFSLGFDNMGEPLYVLDHTGAKTVAIVGGQGREDDREVSVVVGDEYAADWDIEVFVNASTAKTAQGRVDAGKATLVERRTRETLSYAVLQTGTAAYGRDYFLGDLARAKYGPMDVVQQVVGVTVEADSTGEERIEVEMETQ